MCVYIYIERERDYPRLDEAGRAHHLRAGLVLGVGEAAAAVVPVEVLVQGLGSRVQGLGFRL